MKNVSLLIVMLCTIMLFSCSKKAQEQQKQKEIPFVSNTRKNLYKWIDKHAINPEDFKVSNLEVVWATDSLCVINFRAIGENGFGGHVRKEFQYFNMKVNGELWEFADDDRYENGVLDCVKDGFKYSMLSQKKDKTLLRLEKDTTTAGYIFVNAYVDVYNDGLGIGKSGNRIQ